jgi:Tfp pilus assembly pilus retraction ATPase PilT
MYSMDDLFHVVHSDGADELMLQVGQPPLIALDGEYQTLEGPALTAEDTERLLQGLANTRQRRELREHGVVEFIYQFRRRANFVVRARLEGGNVRIEVL